MKSPLSFSIKLVVALFLVFQLPAISQTIQLGAGASISGTSGPSPVNNRYRSQQFQVVYTASELNAAGVFSGNIERLGFFVVSSTSQAMPDYKISLGHTTASSAWPYINTASDQVFYRSAYAPVNGGFDMLRLDTSWYWNGVDNIVLTVCWDYVVYPNIATGTVRTYNDGNRNSYYVSSTDDVCGYVNNNTTFDKPQIQFEFTSPAVNDAGVNGISTPTIACSGSQSADVSIINYGTNIINNVTVNWSVNGVVQTPVAVNTPLDTFGGLGSQTLAVNLGSFPVVEGGTYNLVAWTSSPNGQPDANPDNDSLTQTTVGGLSGIYTIGGGGANYVSFTAAVNALAANGVCGPVTFRVANGGYFEQLVIPHINGASATNTITFESTSGDSSLVVLSHSASSSNIYTVYVNGVDWLTFRGITIESTNNNYDRVVSIGDESDHLAFTNCIIRNAAASSPWNYYMMEVESGAINQGLTVQNCYLLNGYGVLYNGSQRQRDFAFLNNRMVNQYRYGIIIHYVDGVTIEGNTMSSTRDVTTTGFYLYDCDSVLSVQGNIIRSLRNGIGIELNYCDATAAKPSIIANNFVHYKGGHANQSYGIQVATSRHVDVVHNSINVLPNTTGNRGIYINGYNNISLHNNNVFCESGPALYMSYNNSVDASDNNNFYSTGANHAYWLGNVPTLQALQAASGMDSNSFAEPAYYYSDTSYQVAQIALNNNGTPVANVTTDIEGEARNGSNPDIGADEFSPSANDAGIYSIMTPNIPFSPGAQPIYASIRNFGTNALTSATVEWRVNGVAQSNVNFAGSIASGDSAVIMLGNVNMVVGTTYNFSANTILPNGGADAFAPNDTSFHADITPGLGGTFTIGGVSPDFPDFTSAVASLNLGGTIDSVIFNVRDGVYTERLVFGVIPKLDSTNHIMFQSESLDSSAVTLTAGYTNTSENYVLSFNGTIGVGFSMMKIQNSSTNSYSRVVLIDLGSRNLSFWNCSLLSGNTNSSATNVIHAYNSQNGYSEPNNLTFSNCAIRGGYYGIYIQGRNNRVHGLTVEGCHLTEVYYMANYIYYHQNVTLRNNVIRHKAAPNNSAYGIYFYDVHQGEVTGNQVLGHNARYGASFNYCDGTITDTFLIANNFFTSGGTSGSSYALYCFVPTYTLVANNSVWSTNTDASSAAFRDNASSGTYQVLNNIFQNTGGGYAVDLDGSSQIPQRDYNNLFTTGATLAIRSNISSANLVAWMGNYGGDSNSVSVNAQFVGLNDVHTSASALNAAAIPLSLVPTDIDGEPRNPATPDIGADEFDLVGSDAALLSLDGPAKPFAAGNNPVLVSLFNNGGDTLTSVTINYSVNGVAQAPFAWTGILYSSQTDDSVNIGSFSFVEDTNYTIRVWTSLPNGNPDVLTSNDSLIETNLLAALIGPYTIGGLTPDFLNFTESANALDARGIAGNVTFNVRDGVYNEHVTIPATAGTSASDSIIYQSENGDSSLVKLRGTLNQDVLLLNGVSHISFVDLTIFKSYQYGGDLVVAQNSASDINFIRCTLEDTIWSSSSSYSTYLFRTTATTSNENNIRLIDCSFLNGRYGIQNQGINSTNQETGLVIRGCNFINQYIEGVRLTYVQDINIEHNRIQFLRNYTSSTGLYLNSVDDFRVLANQVINPTYIGYYNSDADGSMLNRSLFANNFCQVSGTNTGYAMYFTSSDYVDVVFNSAHSFNTHVNSYAFYEIYNQQLRIQNNIFQNVGAGHAAYIYNIYNNGIHDYNDFFATGANLVNYRNSSHATLPPYVTASGLDSNSISINAQFSDTADFHIEAAPLDGAGIPFAGVMFDIEGDPRDPVSPDIGADEISLNTNDASLTAYVGPNKVFAPGINTVYVNLLNNGSDTLINVQIQWIVNGVPQTAFAWTGSLATGEGEDSVAIGTYNFMAGVNHNLVLYSDQPNGFPDDLPVNDTVTANNRYPGLSGVYTIGGITPDFADFTSAVQALHAGGVTGWVTFNVRDGVYNEQLFINAVMGTSPTDSVVFQSENGDASLVTLEFDANSIDRNTLRLNGTAYLSFRDITIGCTDVTYGYGVELIGSSTDLRFVDCVFEMPNNSSNSFYGIYTPNIVITDLQIMGCQFNYGYAGLYINGIHGPGLVVRNNMFNKQRQYGMYAYQFADPIITENEAVGKSGLTNYYGLYLQDFDSGFDISKNRVHAPFGGHGIYLYDLDGTALNRGLLANNFSTVGDSSNSNNTFRSIYFQYGSYTDIFYNSAHHVSNVGEAMFISNTNNMDVRNNIFSASGTGYALRSNESPANFMALDFNDYYSNGANIFYNGFSGIGPIATLALWKSTTGLDANSINVDPLFVSDVDLHVNQAALDSAAIPVAAVTDDIDGELRDPVNPDIGADEISFLSGDIAITTISAPSSGCTLGDSVQVTVNIANNGTDPQTGFDVTVVVNGDSTTETVAASINSGASISYTFASYYDMSAVGAYVIKAWSSLAGDINAVNDTSNKTVNHFAAPVTTITQDTTVCSGVPVQLTASGGLNYFWSTGLTGPSITVAPNSTTLYKVTVTDGNGCTAVDSVLVTISHTTDSIYVSGTTCDSTMAGLTVNTYVNQGGCDSVVYTMLTYNPSYNTSLPLVTICQGQSATILGQVQTVAGTYYDTLVAANGCDSVLSQTLFVNPSFNTALAGVTICQGQSANIFGVNQSAAGIYYDSLVAANGCDSVLSIVLTVNPISAINQSVEICEGQSVVLGGMVQTTPGVYIDVLTNQYGCDSIITSNLIVHSIDSSFATVALIDGDSILIGGVYRFTSGVYCEIFTGVNSCDSVHCDTVNFFAPAQSLAPSGAPGFITAICDPLVGDPYTTFNFEVSFTDTNGILPPYGYPRILLDYEGNGIFNNANDRVLVLQEADPLDTDPTDGKIYQGSIGGLAVGVNYQTIAQVIAGGNSTTIGPFNYPDVLAAPDLEIFASDISFSNPNPPVSSPLTISATVHNASDYNAQNFTVHMENKCDTGTSFPDILVSNLPARSSTTVSWNITTPAVDAWCPVEVTVDHSNVIVESNELDNYAVRPFTNGNYNIPGAILVNAHTSPNTLCLNPNARVTVSGFAWYDGTAVPLLDSSVAGAQVDLIANGATYTTVTNSLGNFSISIPAQNALGNYTIAGTVTDFTLTGNFSTGYQIISCGCTKPNLTASISPGNITIVQGNSVTGTVTIRNLGTSGAPLSITTMTQTGGLPAVPNQTTPPIAAGGTYSFGYNNIVFNTPGTYSICATADGTFTVDECSEANTGCQTVRVLPNLPDLIPNGGPTVSRYLCQTGNPSFSIRNAGGVPSGPFVARVAISVNGGPPTFFFHSVANIPAEQSYGFSVPYTHPIPGNYTYTLSCDTNVSNGGVVVELSETNNVGVYSRQLYECKPDLTLSGCKQTNVLPIDPVFPGAVVYSANVRNGGNDTAFAPIPVRFTVSTGGTYNTTINSDMPPGQTVVATVNAPSVAPATATLTATVDPLNAIDELVETNNSNTDNLCWDFEPVPTCGYNFWQKNHLVNTSTQLFIGVKVAHLYEASSVDVKFEVSGPGIVGTVDLGNATITNVSKTCACPRVATLPTNFVFNQVGTYTFTMTVDPAGVYAECNEANNVLVQTLQVVSKPDMRILSQFIHPSNLNPNVAEVVDINVTYENIGFSNINDQMALRLMVDNTVVGTISPVKGLVNGDNNTVSFPNIWGSVIPGAHVIRAIIDPFNAINELDELNNEATRAIIVGEAANLFFADLSSSNQNPLLGDPITLLAQVANNGDVDALADLKFSYIDNNMDTIPIGSVPVGVLKHDTTLVQFPWVVLDPTTTIVVEIVNTNTLEFLYTDNTGIIPLGAFPVNIVSVPSCFGANTGSLTATASGGTPPYTYQWSDNTVGPVLNGGPGTYGLTVTDDLGQIVVTSAKIDTIPGTLIVLPVEYVCAGDSTLIFGQYQNGIGNYFDTLVGSGGCDSVLKVSLRVRQGYNIVGTTVSICEGDSALILGMWRHTAGIYYDSLSSVYGCDSVISQVLIVNPVDNDTIPTPTTNAALQGTFTTTTYTNSSGCDSIVTIQWIYTPNPCSTTDSTVVNAITCDSTQAGVAVQTMVGNDGCDSVVTTITVYDPGDLKVLSPITICEGETANVFGNLVSTAGTYYDSLLNANGCDSICVQMVIVKPVYADTTQLQICQGDSALLGGLYRFTSGLYVDSLSTMMSCDSLIYTQLNVVPQINTTAIAMVCEGDSLLLHGAYQSTAGVYAGLYTSAGGCDSVHSITLSIKLIDSTTASASICMGDSIMLGGSQQTTAGTYYDTYTGTDGCDSVVATTLTIRPNATQTVADSICPGDSLYIGGAWQTTAGSYIDVFVAGNGCDSILTTVLTIRTDSGCVADTSTQNCLTVVSDNTWMKSTTVSPSNFSGFWPGAVSLPSVATFTDPVMMGQPYGYPSINTIEGTDVIKTGHSVTYFRKEFSLTNTNDLYVRMLITADDQAEIYLNGHRTALISTFGRPNFKFPAHDAKFTNAVVSNGHLGGDPFDVVSIADLDTVLQAGTNELIVAVRNLGKPSDIGGFSFRMDINCADSVITKKGSAFGTTDPGLLVYPNPAKDVLNIDSELAITTLRLFDFTGKLVQTNTYDSEKTIEISLEGLPKGVYIVEVEEVGYQITTTKVVKQ